MATPHTNGSSRKITRIRVGDAGRATNGAGRTYQKQDSLQNVISGMGGERDKSVFNQFVQRVITAEQLETAYRGDWMTRKVVDIPAYDATREWRAWQADRSDITAIEELEQSLNLKRKLMYAQIKARLYGGGALVLGINQGKPDQPVNLDAIRKGMLQFVHAVSRYELTAGPLNLDVSSPYYGEPEYYDSLSVGRPTRIHPSRVVRLIGAELPRLTISDGWGDSILQIVADAIMQGGSVLQGISQMVHEAQVDVIKFPGLTENVSTAADEEKIKKRFELAATAKSLYNILLLDKEEEWERITATFNNLSDIARLYLEVVAGASDIPATRFLGQAPKGLNATGESDIRNYYDKVASEQESVLTPATERLDEVLVRSALGARPEDIFYEWNPLWQLDEVQKADLAQKKATTFKVDVDAGLLDPVVLKRARENQLIEDGVYPGFEQILEEEQALIEAGLREEPGSEPEPDTNDPNAQEEAGEPGEGGTPPAAPQDAYPWNKKGKKKRTRKIKRNMEDATPRTLYVYRPVLNAKEIIAHFKEQGLETTLPANELHVTIAYSRKHVDWSKAGEAFGQDDKGQVRVAPGGMRVMEKFGEALVMLFSSSTLSYRHQDFNYRCEASWDWPDYQPHLTITYKADGDAFRTMKPWTGPIIFGPEVFEEVNDAYREGLVEDHKARGRTGA